MTLTPDHPVDADRVDGPDSGPSAARSTRGGWRPLLMRLHFYAGIFVGPFLLIAAVSGGLYAIAPTLEQFLYRDYLHVASSGAPQPVADQIRAAQTEIPHLAVTAVRPATAPGETTRVLFDDPTLGESQRRAVFVDPVTVQPRGELVVYGSSGALPLRTWIDQLHRSLHLGDPGRLYSELAASWLWLTAAAGVCLWVGRWRRMAAREAGTARLWTVDRARDGRARTLNWHGAVGLWIAGGLVFLSATGLTWSTYAGAHITDLRAALSWTTPTVSTTLEQRATPAVSAERAGHAGHDPADPAAGTPGQPRVAEVDRVLQAARGAGIGGPVEISIPADPGTAFTVAQTRQPWVLSNNTVAVDGATGIITDTLWFADWPLAAKLAAWGIQLHMGLLFGLANQLMLVVLAVALVTVIVRGYLMWWQRRPTRGGPPVGRPPRRGTLTALPPGVAVAALATAAAIGWFAPLFGASLLAFAAIDIAVGVLQRRRTTR